MDKSMILVAALALGVFAYVSGRMPDLPSIPKRFLFPAQEPDYPTALDAPLYDSPPASENKTLPPIDTGICTVDNLAGFLAWGGSIRGNPTEEQINEVITAEKIYGGCFSPPNK
jgi:hypothetical protein